MLILGYFGLGSFALSSEILLLGIALLIPFARLHTVLTPPWFAFQGQRDAVLLVVVIMLAFAATLNVLLWRSAARR